MTIEHKGIDWEYSKAGMLKAILGTARDILEAGLEFHQNAMDSSIPTTVEAQYMTQEQAYTIPNRIIYKFNPTSDILLTVQDNGLAITKDYGGDIQKFLQAMKADSPKAENPFTCGHKGIGMTMYFLLSDEIEIIAQDDHAGLLSRFTMYIGKNEKGQDIARYSEPEVRGITAEWQKEFGIFRHGTKLIFYKSKTKKLSRNFTKQNVLDKARHIFGLRHSWLTKTVVIADGQAVDMTPDYMKGHPEEHLTTVFVDGKKVDVTGNIYHDPTGRSKLWVIARGGQLVDDVQFKEPGSNTVNRCAGYVYCPEWQPETGRKGVIQNEYWEATTPAITKLTKAFAEVRDGPKESDLEEAEAKWKEGLINKLERLAEAMPMLRKLRFLTDQLPSPFTADPNATDKGKGPTSPTNPNQKQYEHHNCKKGYRWSSIKGKCVKQKPPRVRNLITGRIEESNDEGRPQIEWLFDFAGETKPLVQLDEAQSAFLVNQSYDVAFDKIFHATEDFRDAMISWAIAAAYPEEQFDTFYSKVLNL